MLTSRSLHLSDRVEVIEAVGFGWPQVLATCLCGFVWAADGAELLLLGAVTTAAARKSSY